ncbi:DNA-3-methyladenine glycosylase [Herbiconiux sp. VKM Ac-2851]|uniref:DNA-3-methyladenine glycosylase family protein n=1 Tax=Herbiconiux sp. VKM Ac-2851 TaxID=2739025 RepID=UPI001563E6FF|nr:DNA-3-methyladenine glycosylase 2 family protein [Herbiconiux sp. VKM Ac-2851]NQX37152.1 DNA-3-methyladenine glycosylase 2 family protein [Herbiconiux sp. VKM Ac-2851]
MTTRRPDDTAYSALASADPVLAELVLRVGEPDPFEFPDDGRTTAHPFAGMVLHILAQQISVKVAIILYDRLSHTLGGTPTAERLLRMNPDELRALGTSHAKAGYLLDLATRVHSGDLNLSILTALTDEEAIVALTQVKGVGPWSAEMFLIHQLKRPDVLPAGDLGIRIAVQRAYFLDQTPTIAAVRERAEAWAPQRTYAAALLWQFLKTP